MNYNKKSGKILDNKTIIRTRIVKIKNNRKQSIIRWNIKINIQRNQNLIKMKIE